MATLTGKRRTRLIWPEEAKRLVTKAQRSGDPIKNILLLHNQLQQITGFGSRACWNFLDRNGIRRPAQRIQWDPKIVDFVMEHGYDKAAERFSCDKTLLYKFIQRQNRQVGHCSGQYGLNQLRKLLSVRVSVIEGWIKDNILEATAITFAGKPTWRVSDDQLKRFLADHASGLIRSRRFPEKRVTFLSEYLYDGKHMDLGLLRTRESKKEGEAFRNGEYLTTRNSRANYDAA